MFVRLLTIAALLLGGCEKTDHDSIDKWPRTEKGPGKLKKDGSRAAMQLKAGDKVLFTSWAGDEFREGQRREEILLMREEDILAVLDE